MTMTGAIVVRSGADRFDDVTMLGIDRNFVKVSGRETNGRLAVFEYIGSTPGGPPRHVHHDQDEAFIVLEGSYIFECDGSGHELEPGDTILLPRGRPHSFCQTSATGRLLFTLSPAGSMETFFAALAALPPGAPEPGIAEALFAKHGMRVVGPPIALD